MNALVMLRQAPAKPVAPIIPQYSVEAFTADGVVVHVCNQDDTTSEFLVDWDADRDGATMNATCTLTVFAEDGKTLSEEEIETPDWIHYALPHDVEGYLTRREEERAEDLCCEPDFF
ncbi:MAG: hypothetical protein WA154_12230 [Moraxellaceae bacterium]